MSIAWVVLGKLVDTDKQSKQGTPWGLPEMTLMERAAGVCICWCLGCLISLLSIFSLTHPKRFGITYTLGNIVSLVGVAFLCGFQRQFGRMMHKSRRLASFMYFGFMAATLGTAFGLPPKFWPLVLVFVLCQFGASLWYAFSYIPYGRAFLKGAVKGVVTNVLPKPPTRLFR
jgi:hypothetical protein